ncbi:MAG: cupin domain-containing protein [Silicimonas sp.]|nr:cupin domain-containing protein [Silicimonas sp.]
MKILRSGSQPVKAGPAEYFTGEVTMEMEFAAETPARIGGLTVTFAPGARTAWHSHPLGQTVFVTEGEGWAQLDGEPRQVIRPGDIVWFPPNRRHWHGATATSAMTHLAIAESLDGSRVTWEDHVSDADYLGG